MAECIYNLPKVTDQKKKSNSVKIYRKDADRSKNYFLVNEFFCATFSFWDIDFVTVA